MSYVMNLQHKMTRRQFLGAAGAALLSVTVIGGGTTHRIISLPTEGEYGYGRYSEKTYT